MIPPFSSQVPTDLSFCSPKNQVIPPKILPPSDKCWPAPKIFPVTRCSSPKKGNALLQAIISLGMCRERGSLMGFFNPVIPTQNFVQSHLPRILSILNFAQILLEKHESRASIKGNPGAWKTFGGPFVKRSMGEIFKPEYVWVRRRVYINTSRVYLGCPSDKDPYSSFQNVHNFA